MSKLEKTLKYIGIFAIIVGVLVPLFNIGELKDLKEDADYWKSSYMLHPDNYLIEAKATNARSEYDATLDSIVTLGFGGVISGLLFISFGYLLTHSRNASENARSTNILLKEFRDYVQKNEEDKRKLLVKLEKSTQKEQASPVEV